MQDLDHRLNAYRPDLADAALKGKVEAENFTAGKPMQVNRGAVPLFLDPRTDGELATQLLFGEAVTCFDRATETWAWVRNDADGYVGYVFADALAETCHAPTHTVAALRTYLFQAANLKSPVLDTLTMTSPVAVGEQSGKYSEVNGRGWVYTEHLAPLGDVAPDYTATALGFLGAPYRWGGKESIGLDCSGLIQVVLNRAGIDCLRDTDMQAETLGEIVANGGDGYTPSHGDIIYMPGHAVIALDDSHVVNATAHGLRVRTEPLADVLARVKQESGGDIKVVRRPAA